MSRNHGKVTALALALVGSGTHAATITVNSSDDAADSAFCNLRNAIASAINGAATANCAGQASGAFSEPNTVQFAGNLANATIAMAQGAFSIDGASVVLAGSGQTINAGGASTVFFVVNAASLSASHVTATSGNVGAFGVGGGSQLTLSHSTISNSSGGAIYVGAYCSLVLDDTTVSGNSSAQGGGIKLRNATATLTNSTISGNSASGNGGGVYSRGGSLTMTASTVSANGANGYGGGIFSDNNTLSLDHVTMSGNHGAQAGAAYLRDVTATILASNLSGNTAYDNYSGGAIYAKSSTVTAVDSTFAQNSSSTQAASELKAGAIYLYNSKATIVNATITGNQVAGHDFLAGGIWELHDPDYATDGLMLINTTISANTAYSVFDAGSHVAGGIAVGIPRTGSDVGSATVYNTIVSANLPAGKDIWFGAATWTTGYNLFGAAQNFSTFNDASNHNVFSDTPGLAGLAGNGGPTQTMALLGGSPALAAGSVALAQFDGKPLNYDQRGNGYARTLDGTVDIGSFESRQSERIFSDVFEPAP